MTVARTARRRRKQAAQGYTHIDKMRRPRYANKSAEASRKRLQQVIDNERRMAQSKGKSSKK